MSYSDDDIICPVFDFVEEQTESVYYDPLKILKNTPAELKSRQLYNVINTNPLTFVPNKKRKQTCQYQPKIKRRKTLPTSIHDEELLSDNDEVHDGDEDIYLLSISGPSVRLVTNLYDYPLFDREIGFINDENDCINTDSDSDYDPDNQNICDDITRHSSTQRVYNTRKSRHHRVHSDIDMSSDESSDESKNDDSDYDG